MRAKYFGYSLLVHAGCFAVAGFWLWNSPAASPEHGVEVTLVAESGGGGGAAVQLPTVTAGDRRSSSAVHASEQPEIPQLPSSEQVALREPLSTGQKTTAVGAVRPGSGTGTGTGYGTGSGAGKGNGAGAGDGSGFGDGFQQGADGIYTALSADSVDYTVLYAPDPIYPREAYDVGYTKTVDVTIRLCVDTDGSIMKIDILTEVPSLGFREEVLRVASQWRFAPVTYRGTPVRMNFVKTFTFRP